MNYCPHCKKELAASFFYLNSHRKSGLSILCKTCHKLYESSPERRAKRTWNTINCRSGGRQKSYADVLVLMTRNEFLNWAIPEYKKWMRNNPNMTPSLDRIDPSKHYSINNIRIIERGENCRLSRNHMNVHAPNGTAWCHSCKEYLDISYFWKSKSSYNGLQKRCKQCQTEAINRSHDLQVYRRQTNL